jgi:hypothetical protein
MKNMTFAAEGESMIVLHTATPPSDDEWAAWISALRKLPRRRLKLLIFTDGGAPNTLQRGTFLDHLADAQPPIAFVSNVPAVRGVVTALSWFNRNVKLFSPAQLREAFAHLNLTEEQGRALFSTAQRATAELGTILAAFKPSAAP